MLLFSVSTIMSIPGILISVGVILLIIALVLFITTSKTNKKIGDVPITSSDDTTTVVTPEVTATVQPTAENVVEEKKEEVSSQPVNVSINTTPVAEEPVSVSMDAPVTPEVKTPEVVPVVESVPVVEATPVGETAPAVEPALVVEEAKIVEPAANIPNVEAVNSMPVVEPTVSEEKPVSIYGGASPSVEVHEEVKDHQIYGGADPMEKTQTIPVINHSTEAYGGNGVTEAKIVDQKEEDKDVEVLDF